MRCPRYIAERPRLIIAPGSLIILLAGILLWMFALGATPASADHVPEQPDTHVFTAEFETSGQSTHSQGESFEFSDTISIIDESFEFNESEEFLVTVVGFDFGGSFEANFEFEAGLDLTLRIDTGTVAVDYPTEVTLSSPAKDSFKPGDTITITSDWDRSSGASITTSAPSGAIELAAIFKLIASASGKICAFGCPDEPTALFDPLNIDEDIQIIPFTVDIPVVGPQTFAIDSTLPIQIPPPRC